jgi:hypothetical protein
MKRHLLSGLACAGLRADDIDVAICGHDDHQWQTLRKGACAYD